MYDDRDDIGANSAVAEQVGHKFLGSRFGEAYQSMHASQELVCVKTHDVPIDDGKAIYIVRDGRSASYSYLHYQRDFGQRPEAALADTVIGFTPFGSWSDHLDAWNPLERPNTLLLRYELLISEPEEQIERIAAFLDLRPLHPWNNDFDMLHSLEPRFFREGASAALHRFDEAEESLFWLMHGAWMARLGYASADAGPAAASLHARRLFYQCISRHQGQMNSLNLALSQQMGERELLKQQLQDMQHRVAVAQAQKEDVEQQLTSAEQKLARLAQVPMWRTWSTLRSRIRARHVVSGRHIRAGIAATLALLAAAIYTE